MLVSVDWQAVAAQTPAGGLLRLRPDAAARIWPDEADARFAAEKPLPEERPTPHDWADVEEIIREDMTAWDHLPFESGARFWEAYLESYPML
ncbi:hypothetical protein [Kitasatospora sp. NPDC059673]|uniref:hypothetical protein n=1 Tax=Kitasatospora sp. NPDC059673 TaxID=3346901 RepID=UPI0036813577